MKKEPARRISWISQEGVQIADACSDADVNSGDVKDWMERHPTWTLDEAINRFKNLNEQAARRASHDTGYQRREWRHW